VGAVGRRAPAFLVGLSYFNALAVGFSRFRTVGGKLSAIMPRHSDADLSIVPMLPGKGRPQPPKALDQTEARAWNDVIDALPGHWVDAAAQIVLRRVAAQVAIAERIEARLRDLAMMGTIRRRWKPNKRSRACIGRPRNRSSTD
jgi:hypothetical protein